MINVHMILQGKGGVGKTLVASYLYQGLTEYGKQVCGLDLDPINHTFKSYGQYDVAVVNILNEKKDIDKTSFDNAVNLILDKPDESHVILDCGSSSYVAFRHYLLEEDGLPIMEENGLRVFLHFIVAGGGYFYDTVNDIVEFLKILQAKEINHQINLWKNFYYGPLCIIDSNNERLELEDTQHYEDLIAPNLSAIIDIPEIDDATHKYIKEMITSRKTFKEVIETTHNVMVKSRVQRYWKKLYGQLSNAPFMEGEEGY